MAAKEKLIFLISKLSTSEKGYVNKHLKLSSPNSNLLKVYNIISKYKPKDEKALKHRIKDAAILKNFAVTKKQLFDRILEILRDYHSYNGELRKLLGMIQDIGFLFSKGMVDEC